MAAPEPDSDLRRRLLAVARRMSESGLSPGRSGNVSARTRDGLLITPSGMAYDRLAPEDLVLLDWNGTAAPGQHVPSTEWHFHLAIYRARPEAGGIVHAHSLYATALACARLDIPAFHYMVAVAGGADIRCGAYATFGTEELAESALKALAGRRACLLANHGQIALGETVETALGLAEEVETLAAQYWHVLQIGGPRLLDAAEMARVGEKFKTYGTQPPGP